MNALPCTSYITDSCAGIYVCPGQTCPMRPRVIWGGGPSDPGYTGDSQPCQAAKHCGAISMITGGMFALSGPGPGAQSFEGGSMRFGVKANSWGSYHVTYNVTSRGAAVVPNSAAQSSASSDNHGPRPCTSYMNDTCTGVFVCPGVNECPKQARAVWGGGTESGGFVNMFTGDSSICAAARCAGVIGANGGKFRLKTEPGHDSYFGVERNAVVTKKWGSYSISFSVWGVEASDELEPKDPPKIMPIQKI